MVMRNKTIIETETLEFPTSTLTLSDTCQLAAPHHNELRAPVGPTKTRAWTSRPQFGAYNITPLAPRFQTYFAVPSHSLHFQLQKKIDNENNEKEEEEREEENKVKHERKEKEGLFQSFTSYTHHSITIAGSVGQGL